MDIEPSEIVLLGSGSKNKIWNQIKANILAKTLKIPQTTDAASLGAMLLAAVGIGAFKDPYQTALKLNHIVKDIHPKQKLAIITKTCIIPIIKPIKLWNRYLNNAKSQRTKV